VTITKKIAAAQGVGSGTIFDVRGTLRWTFQTLLNGGYDRTTDIQASVDGTNFVSITAQITPPLSLTQLWGKFEGIFNYVKVVVSGGTTGTVDVWMMSSDS
jgi:hypothetical protein